MSGSNALRGIVLAGILTMSAALAAEANRPNILWITTEDMNPNLGCYGDRYARTPHLDRLAAESVRYTNCFATAPVCSTSRFTLITGVNPTSAGTSNHRSLIPLPGFLKGFPTYLRQRGYFCSNNSKTDYNVSLPDTWDESSNRAHWRHRKPGQPFFAVFNDMVTHQSRDSVWPYEQFVKQVQSKLTAEEIHDPAQAPLPPYLPDTPIMRRTIARYYDCITVMDKHVGALLADLDTDGLAEDTIVFFFADNGAGLIRAKAAAYDNGVREPLLVRFPKKYRHLAPAAPGSVVDRIVSFVDFAPTVLAVAEIRKPQHVQGRGFLGPHAEAAPECAFGVRDRIDEAVEVTRWANDGRFHYIRSFRPYLPADQHTLFSQYNGAAESVQELRRMWKAGQLTAMQRQFWGDSRPVEALYDVVADPHNLRNLADQPEFRVKLEEMRRRLHAWMQSTRDTGLLPEPDLLPRVGAEGIPYLFVRSAGYPFERILATAERVGTGSNLLPDRLQALKDSDAGVRFWAVVAVHALGSAGKATVPALKAALSDPSPAVRIEAAWTLGDLGEPGDATKCLLQELSGSNEWAACYAARSLELLGKKAPVPLSALGDLAEKWKKSYPVACALQGAIERRQ